MAGLIKSCLLCGLKTGCFFVAFYTFILAFMLLTFNVHDLVYAREYLVWSRILSFIVSVLLFFAAFSLLIGLFRNSQAFLAVWIFIFTFALLYQIAFVSWGIHYYSNVYEYDRMPPAIRTITLAEIIVFGVLIFVNVLALVGVHSEREYIMGKGVILVPTSA